MATEEPIHYTKKGQIGVHLPVALQKLLIKMPVTLPKKPHNNTVTLQRLGRFSDLLYKKKKTLSIESCRSGRKHRNARRANGYFRLQSCKILLLLANKFLSIQNLFRTVPVKVKKE
jgi:hypothetical protein